MTWLVNQRSPILLESYIQEPTIPNILDNFGVTLNMQMLDAWPAYVAARDALYGHGVLSRWWMRNVYPHLRPYQWYERLQTLEQKQVEMQGEFLNAVESKKKSREGKNGLA